MSSSVAVFDDGLAHHDWSRPSARNGDSRPYNPGHSVPPQPQFDSSQSWNQVPAGQMPSYGAQPSAPFAAYQPTSAQIVSPSGSEFPQSRTQMGAVQHYQPNSVAYASHERAQIAQSPYTTASDHAQSSPIDSSATAPHYPRYSYDTTRPMYPGDNYSSSSNNPVYASTSSSNQPVPPPATTLGSSTYEQPSGGNHDYGYVQSNANSLAYAEPIAPQPQRPRADFTQVS